MNLRLLLLLFCLAFAFTLPAASWYVDNAATGENDGTSWSNAWMNPTNVVWASVLAGDTVFVSGGSTTKLYVDSLVIGKDGTAGSPITVRIGQDAGHNGIAIFSNATVHPNGSRPKWNVIDGGRSPSFVAPTNHRQVALSPAGANQTTTITNNIGFWLKDAQGTADSVTSPNLMFLRKPDNCTFKWMAFTTMTNTGSFEFHENRGTAIYFDQGDETQPATNTVFEYLFFFGNMGQQIGGGAGPFSGAAFDEIDVRFCWFDQCGEDHVEQGGGISIHDCVIGPCYPNGVHNDFFQFTGNHIKVYNNDIRESQNAIMRIQTSLAGAGTNVRHSIWFYNNLVTEKIGRAVGGGTLVEPFCIVHFDSQSPTHMTILSNIVFANNLLFDSILSTAIEPDEMSRNQVMYWTRGAQVTNSIVTSNVFANNLVIMKHKGIGFPVSTNIQAAQTYWPHTTNDMWVDYNTFAGTNRYTGTISNLLDPRRVGYMDSTTNIEHHPFKFNNTTNWPAFTDPVNDNFELADGDTAAKDTGYDLSAYFTTDALNRPRTGVWDRGPLEQQNTLLVSLTFEDNFTLQPYITDQSGNGNHAWRYGYTNSAAGSNFPNRVSAALTPGTNTSSYAGEFAWYADGHGDYGRSGDYAAITNGSAFTNLTTATIAVRARYYASYNDDYTEDANAVLLSAGDAVNARLGSWNFGRWNQSIFLNETRFIVSTNSNQGTPQSGSESSRWFGKAGRLVGRFDDAWAPINDGDTTNWHHYAVTWDHGIIKLYYDGVAIGTNDVSAVITNLNVGAGWIAVGANTHVGTNPYLNDLTDSPPFPNNGFLNGVIDDVRIYNVALSAAQVQALAGTTAASTRRIMRVVGNVRAGNVTIQGN